MFQSNIIPLGGNKPVSEYVNGIRNGENLKNVFRNRHLALRAFTVGTVHRLPSEMIKHIIEVAYSELAAREAFPENKRGAQK
jgi:hypothetical protein